MNIIKDVIDLVSYGASINWSDRCIREIILGNELMIVQNS